MQPNALASTLEVVRPRLGGGAGAQMNTLRDSAATFACSVVVFELEAEPDDAAGVADRIVSKLHDALGKLVGTGGFEALLARAIVLARRTCPALAGVRAASGGRIDGFRGSMAAADAATTRVAAEALVAHFVELLLVLVGEDVGMRLVGAAWSDAPGLAATPDEAIVVEREPARMGADQDAGAVERPKR